jgi:hypothetical protein
MEAGRGTYVFGVPLPAAPPRTKSTRNRRSAKLRDATLAMHLRRELCVAPHPALPTPPTNPIPRASHDAATAWGAHVIHSIFNPRFPSATASYGVAGNTYPAQCPPRRRTHL